MSDIRCRLSGGGRGNYATHAINIGAYGARGVSNSSIQGIICAGVDPLGAAIVEANWYIYVTIEVELRCGATIEMGLCGECGADAEDERKGQDRPFDLFHTKLFLVF